MDNEELKLRLEQAEKRIAALERQINEMEQVIAVLGIGGNSDE